MDGSLCWRCKKKIVVERQEIKGRKTPTGEQKEDEKSFKSSMDRAWIFTAGRGYPEMGWEQGRVEAMW